jgi:hypothetical protein
MGVFELFWAEFEGEVVESPLLALPNDALELLDVETE